MKNPKTQNVKSSETAFRRARGQGSFRGVDGLMECIYQKKSSQSCHGAPLVRSDLENLWPCGPGTWGLFPHTAGFLLRASEIQKHLKGSKMLLSAVHPSHPNGSEVFPAYDYTFARVAIAKMAHVSSENGVYLPKVSFSIGITLMINKWIFLATLFLQTHMSPYDYVNSFGTSKELIA